MNNHRNTFQQRLKLSQPWKFSIFFRFFLKRSISLYYIFRSSVRVSSQSAWRSSGHRIMDVSTLTHSTNLHNTYAVCKMWYALIDMHWLPQQWRWKHPKLPGYASARQTVPDPGAKTLISDIRRMSGFVAESRCWLKGKHKLQVNKRLWFWLLSF